MGEVLRTGSSSKLFVSNKVSSIDIERSPIAFEEPTKSRSLSVSSKKTDPTSSLNSKLLNPPRPQFNWYEEDALDNVDITKFSWWDVASVCFLLYIVPLIINLLQQSMPYVYDPNDSFRTSTLIVTRITVYGYIGLAMNFTYIPHIFGITVHWWYTVIAMISLTLFAPPLQILAIYKLGYPTVSPYLIPGGILICGILIMTFNGYKFYQKSIFRQSFLKCNNLIVFGVIFLLALTAFRWAFANTGRDLQIVFGFFFPFLEYGAKQIVRKITYVINPQYVSLVVFWFSHQATLYFAIYIIPVAGDTEILWVLLASKLSLLLAHYFRATDYYFNKFVFPNINLYHWERSHEAKYVHNRKVVVDFIFNVMNETLSLVYYFPIVAVTRFGYNAEAFPKYNLQNMLHVVYYYACSAVVCICVGFYIAKKQGNFLKGCKLCIMHTRKEIVWFAVVIASSTGVTIN